MPTEEPQDIDEVLDRVLRDQPLGEQPEGHSEEIELHKPLMRQCAEPPEVDPATNAALRKRLGGEGVPQPRRHSTDCGDR
jgi:hypothetical protein